MGKQRKSLPPDDGGLRVVLENGEEWSLVEEILRHPLKDENLPKAGLDNGEFVELRKLLEPFRKRPDKGR